jgi:hypothetical protein
MAGLGTDSRPRSSPARTRSSGRAAAFGWLRSTPGRLRGSVAIAALLACALAVLLVLTTSGLRGGVQSIGQRDAPEVDSSTGLYFSVSDMDAQVANVLLVGSDPALTADRSQDLAIYQQDRQTADQDLQQAAIVAAASPPAQRELRATLDALGQYEALAAEAILMDQQSASPAGQPSVAALGFYRQATDLMRTGMLPDVTALTSVNANALDSTYDAKRSDATLAIALTVIVGLALTAALAGTQAYLASRFRRVASPALILATLLTLALTIGGAAQLNTASQHLRVAKVEAFDSILALTQARAVSYDANADESRYLVDRGRAAQYQQSFLTKSLELADVGNVGIYQYDAALTADIEAYDKNNADVRFGGYLGAEFRNITFPGERAAAVRTLLAYQLYERDDRKLRAMARTSLPQAIAYDIGTANGQSDWAFNQYAAALSGVLAINEQAFAAAIKAGEDGWNDAVPIGCAVLVVALTFAAVRPRLAEYR